MIKNEKLRKAVRLLSILFLVSALYLFGGEAISNINHQKEIDKLSNIKEDVTETIIDTTDTTPIDIKPEIVMGSIEFYNKLKETNKDYVGWISMPGLLIDHPVVIGKDNVYYLTHSLYKAYNKYGTIFVDYRNKNVFAEAHLVIYGHHMKNKSMFSHLDELRTKSKYEANKIIQIYTQDGLKKYLIFSVYPVDAAIYSLSLPYKGNIKTLIAEYVKKSLYKTGVDVSKATQVLTLVTCTLAVTNGRLLVHAIPIN